MGMERAVKCSMMYSSPRRQCHSLISDTPCCRTIHADTRALSNSRLAAVYLWLAIAKAVSHCPGRLKLFDAAKMRGTHTHTHTHTWRHQAASVIWASLGVERRDAWQINCWYRISHTHFTGTSPLLFVYHFTSVSHDLQWGGLHSRLTHAQNCGLSDRRGWPDGAADCCLPSIGIRLLRKVLGQYQYHPILASIGQYLNTGIVRTLVSSVLS